MKKAALLVLVILLFCVGGCTRSSGIKVGAVEHNTPTLMSMSYKSFDGYIQRTFKIDDENVIIKVAVETDSGELDAYIAKDNDTDNAVYEGNDIPTSGFTVRITEPGSYTIRVDAHKHSGSYSFDWTDQPE